MAYGDCKDIQRRTAADKVFRDKAFNIAKNPKYGGYQRGLTSVVCKFCDKTLLVEQLKMKLFLIKNYLKNYTNQLLEDLRNKCTLTLSRQYLEHRSGRYVLHK